MTGKISRLKMCYNYLVFLSQKQYTNVKQF